jgi:uncharacterized protein (TIGR02757 family)
MFFGMMMKTDSFPERDSLREILESRADLYNRTTFIETDPISIPHQFSDSEDIAISGFLTATIAWGQRVTLIRNAQSMMNRMDLAPADFVRSFKESDLAVFDGFVHRTFNANDLKNFLRSLQRIEHELGSLENAFRTPSGSVFEGIIQFRSHFLGLSEVIGMSRHVANPAANSAAKRINMYLRWMVRVDKRKVDFGLWKVFQPSELICPLDVHSGGVARKLGILRRSQNDWQAAVELTEALRTFDREDPIRFDFALFGLGAFENFRSEKIISPQ